MSWRKQPRPSFFRSGTSPPVGEPFDTLPREEQQSLTRAGAECRPAGERITMIFDTSRPCAG